MLHPAYIAGWEQKRFQVCGKLLRPMTLGHARVLYFAESPVVVPGSSDIGLDDVLLAVCVCALTVAPKYSELDAIAAEALDLSAGAQEEEAAKFAEYVKTYCRSLPAFSDDEPSRTPWPWSYYSILRRFYGYGDEEAWSELCCNAFWMAQAVAVQNGNTKYMNLDEIEIALKMENPDA